MDARHPRAELQINTGCLVKFEFQINKNFSVHIHSMQY